MAKKDKDPLEEYQELKNEMIRDNERNGDAVRFYTFAIGLRDTMGNQLSAPKIT